MLRGKDDFVRCRADPFRAPSGDLAARPGQSASAERQIQMRAVPRLLPLFVESEWAHVGAGLHDVLGLALDLQYDGFFLDGNVLTNINSFSAEEHQIVPRNNPASGKRYVKNFIFIPR
ncbi:MAG TPA: hypothetical protein VMS01_00335 [Stellaceae bacterium]|nr:hypothetical protein [Stellaceae bacterium]